MWRVIVITPEETFAGEVEQIKKVLECGVFRLHLRHPNASEKELRKIIEALSVEERKRIVLHDCYNLVDEYGLGGAHLNGRHPELADICTSRSCHSFAEIEASKRMRYCFLSPIFDSISKNGYSSNFSREVLLEAKQKGIINENVIALGGISADKLEQVKEYGFGGVAVLGSAWKDGVAQIEKIKDLL